MKYLLLFILTFAASCGLFKKNKSMHYGDGDGQGGGNSHKDSTSITLEMPDSEYVSHNHVVLTSNDELWFPPKPKSANLKIITIQNTKVISQSKDVSEGRVVYKIPEKMKIRSTYKVVLRIAKSKAILSVYDSLQGEVRTSEIPVTQTMEVKLIDANKSFEIVQDNNAVQLIENGDTYTEWTWSVMPIKTGNSNLKIVVSIIRDGNKKDIVYEDSVLVEKDIPTQIMFFWDTYFQWIIGTFLLPFFLWFYRSRKKKKEEV